MSRNLRFWLLAPIVLPITVIVLIGVAFVEIAERTLESGMRDG